MAQQYKIDKVNYISSLAKGSANCVLTDYRGLTVQNLESIRAELRKLNTKYAVVKNNLFKIAATQNGLPVEDEFLAGPTAVAFAGDDVSEVVKALFKFTKSFPVKVKAGIIDGKFFNDKEIEAFSKLPGRKELIAQLMATMNAPMQNFVLCCNDVIGRFVRVVNAVKESKEKAS